MDVMCVCIKVDSTNRLVSRKKLINHNRLFSHSTVIDQFLMVYDFLVEPVQKLLARLWTRWTGGISHWTYHLAQDLTTTFTCLGCFVKRRLEYSNFARTGDIYTAKRDSNASLLHIHIHIYIYIHICSF